MTRDIFPRSLLVALLAFAPGIQAEWLSNEQSVMGTVVRVELWTDSRRVGEAAVTAVMDEVRRVDRLMSTYKENSEISLVNRQAAAEPVRAPAAAHPACAIRRSWTAAPPAAARRRSASRIRAAGCRST